MSDMFGGGGGPPAPPPFHPIKIEGDKGIADRALRQDIRRYLSYEFPVFPGLAKVRQAEIEDAYKQLTGPLSPEFQSVFMNRATVGASAVTGGGNPYGGMALRKGAFAHGAQSAAFTRQAMAKQDYDRTRMESLIGQNPVPGLGLTQNDIASLYIYNTGAQNTWSMGNYANQIAGANAAYQNQVNTWNTIGNTIGALGNIWSSYNLSNNAGQALGDAFNFNSINWG